MLKLTCLFHITIFNKNFQDLLIVSNWFLIEKEIKKKIISHLMTQKGDFLSLWRENTFALYFVVVLFSRVWSHEFYLLANIHTKTCS